MENIATTNLLTNKLVYLKSPINRLIRGSVYTAKKFYCTGLRPMKVNYSIPILLVKSSTS